MNSQMKQLLADYTIAVKQEKYELAQSILEDNKDKFPDFEKWCKAVVMFDKRMTKYEVK